MGVVSEYSVAWRHTVLTVTGLLRAYIWTSFFSI